MNLDRSSHQPLYRQLAALLKKRSIKPGQTVSMKLPTEEQLSLEFEVSRGTVRQAMKLLEREGMIKRQPGKGTFVIKKAAIQQELSSLKSLTTIFNELGETPVVEVSEFRFVVPAKSVVEKLALNEGEDVLFVLRKHILKDKPAAISFIYIPRDLGESLSAKELQEETIFKLFETRCNVEIGYAKQLITAYSANTRLAELLDCKPKDALLVAERVVFDNQSRPIELVSFFYRPNVYGFSAKLPWRGSENSDSLLLDWDITEEQLFLEKLTE